jgi:peptidoglycan hydrolase-like protein with peptidoglycan-binding domain
MRPALALAALALAGCGGAHHGSAAPPASATASVERRDLVDRDSVSGTLGYADDGTLSAGAAGTITRLRAEGSVVRRGRSLYSLDGHPAAWLLYGDLPAWRDFTPGMSDGADVRQLERNLRALGYEPGDVDGHWDADTTAAVERFQKARDLTQTGALSRTQILFRGGPTRIGQLRAAAGDQVAPGRPLAQVTSTRQQVTVALDAERQTIARDGERVSIDLPSGRTVWGHITDVGSVATQGRDGATIPVTIALHARATRLDQAPVDVGFAVERRRDALAVPVKALLARQGGGYAVELTDRRIVPVTPGLFAGDWVEVAGALHPGQRVVTAE